MRGGTRSSRHELVLRNWTSSRQCRGCDRLSTPIEVQSHRSEDRIVLMRSIIIPIDTTVENHPDQSTVRVPLNSVVQ